MQYGARCDQMPANRASTTDISGLAGRLKINARVDRDQGGMEWRIRDGMQTVSPQTEGNSSIISNLKRALNTSLAPTTPGRTQAGSMLDFAANTGSLAAASSLQAQKQLANTTAVHSQIQQLAFAEGVDTDAELQRLLAVETNYAANAKVIEAVAAEPLFA